MDHFHGRDHKLKGNISNDINENINYVKIAGCVLICLGILVVIYDEFKEES